MFGMRREYNQNPKKRRYREGNMKNREVYLLYSQLRIAMQKNQGVSMLIIRIHSGYFFNINVKIHSDTFYSV